MPGIVPADNRYKWIKDYSAGSLGDLKFKEIHDGSIVPKTVGPPLNTELEKQTWTDEPVQ